MSLARISNRANLARFLKLNINLKTQILAWPAAPLPAGLLVQTNRVPLVRGIKPTYAIVQEAIIVMRESKLNGGLIQLLC